MPVSHWHPSFHAIMHSSREQQAAAQHEQGIGPLPAAPAPSHTPAPTLASQLQQQQQPPQPPVPLGPSSCAGGEMVLAYVV